MTRYNAANERMKREYFAYLAEAQGYSEQTIDAVAKAIARFEAYTKWRDFRRFHIEQAKGFKHWLAEQHARRSGEPLSKATLYATLNALRRFFTWLAGQPGYKSRISYSDADYFNLSAKEARIAKAARPARVPTLEQIRHVIQTMPATMEIERRDRALIAFTILTGARDGATASFKLRHIDIERGQIDQDAREVRTKFAKSFVTTFFPVGEDIRAVVTEWVAYLRRTSSGDWTIRYSRQRKSRSVAIKGSGSSDLIASIGAKPDRSESSLRRRSRRRASRHLKLRGIYPLRQGLDCRERLSRKLILSVETRRRPCHPLGATCQLPTSTQIRGALGQ
jgi:site-specific recombinase XerD